MTLYTLFLFCSIMVGALLWNRSIKIHIGILSVLSLFVVLAYYFLDVF